jgi:hypothetical protein
MMIDGTGILLILLLFQLCILPSSQFGAATTTLSSSQKRTPNNPKELSGAWSTAKHALRDQKCCVVSVKGLDQHLLTLQSYFCGQDAPSDIDLRMRVRCHSGDINDNHAVHNSSTILDCNKIYNTIMDPPPRASISTEDKNQQLLGEQTSGNFNINPCILALEELAQGVCSLADGPLQSSVTDVHMRIVCASNYKAIDPPFHTDKCPLRGYVTLAGPGTEYMDSTCTPLEYAGLRTLGVEGLTALNRDKAQRSLKMANELEFIVMKGDYYDAHCQQWQQQGRSVRNNKKLWTRSDACVHRSPPANDASVKRVILSLDLADGGDDQEWDERGRKRSWRVGMTQRKSHLVS